MDGANPVLAHKLGLTTAKPSEQSEGTPTPTRQMRRALGRAADKAVALSASVLGIAQEDQDVEDLISTGPEGWVVLGLRDGGSAGLSGLFLIDPALRSAFVEMQTMGSLLPPQEEPRKVTRTDGVMCIPFADQMLKELAEVGFENGDLDLAGYDMGPMDDLRTAGLVMVQGVYRTWRVSIQIGGGDCQGEMLIALRPKVSAAAPNTASKPDWAQDLRRAVEEAPAELDAVLTKIVLPISLIQEFVVGQMLPLAGTTVGSVTLTGPAGEVVAAAKLGQIAGKRAVRLEVASVELQEDVPKVASPPAAPPQVEVSEVVPEAAAG